MMFLYGGVPLVCGAIVFVTLRKQEWLSLPDRILWSMAIGIVGPLVAPVALWKYFWR